VLCDENKTAAMAPWTCWFFWSGMPCDLVIGPVGDIVSDVEKTIRVQETVMILTDFCRPTVKLVGVRRKSLGDLWADVDCAMLVANEGNAVVVLNAIYYAHEIGVFLKNLAYRRLAKDPTKTIVLKKSLLADDICRLHPVHSRHPRHYRHLKIHKERVTVVPARSNIGGYLPVVQASALCA